MSVSVGLTNDLLSIVTYPTVLNEKKKEPSCKNMSNIEQVEGYSFVVSQK